MLCELHKLKISEKYDDSLIKNTYFKPTFSFSCWVITSCVFIFTTPFQLNRAKKYIWWISTTGGIRTRTTTILSCLPPVFWLLWHIMRWCKESTAPPCFLSLLLLYKTNLTDSLNLHWIFTLPILVQTVGVEPTRYLYLEILSPNSAMPVYYIPYFPRG